MAGYNADIICLQEVDKKVFERDLCPRLEEVGLCGDARMKYGEVSEGSAIFYRSDRFRLGTLMSCYKILAGRTEN